MGICSGVNSNLKDRVKKKVGAEIKTSENKTTKGTEILTPIRKEKDIEDDAVKGKKSDKVNENKEDNSEVSSISNVSIEHRIALSEEYKKGKRVSRRIKLSNKSNAKVDAVIDISLWKNIKDYYIFGKNTIGEGTFGEVRIAKKKNDPSTNFFAVKSIYKPSIDTENIPYLITEIQHLVSLDHPNIIKFYESYQDEYFVHLVMEYCSGGELFNQILKQKKIKESVIAQIIWNILSAISYCHSKGIVHRDIKPENILLDNDDITENDYSGVKLIDFGLAKKFESQERLKSILGTNFYIAPEVLEENYDAKSDVWSIGVITYFLCSRRLPFYDKDNNDYKLFEKIKNEQPSFEGKVWNGISDDAKNFIKRCLVKDPEKRCSASEALNNIWFMKTKQDKKNNIKSHLCSKSLNNLLSFRKTNKLKKLIIKAIIHNFVSCEELRKLRKVFQSIDIDQIGYISIDELKDAFSKCNIEISNTDIESIVNTFNEKDGKIDYTTFLVMSLDPSLYIGRDIIEKVFDYFDVDQSQWVGADDIRNVLIRFGVNARDYEDVHSCIIEVTGGRDKLLIEDFLRVFEQSY